MALKYLNSPQCVLELSLVWHLQVWWFPQLDRAPMMDTSDTLSYVLHKHVYNWPQTFDNPVKSVVLNLTKADIIFEVERQFTNIWHNKFLHTTSGNSSLTRDMMREVFPTLAVEGGRDKSLAAEPSLLSNSL